MAKRFILAKLSVTDKNQFAIGKVALPPSVKKVVSVTVSSIFKLPALRTTKYYVGIDTVPGAYNEAFVLALTNKDYIKSTVATYTLTPEVGEHIFLARPKRLGRPSFEVDGDSYAFNNPEVISITDPVTGYVEDYCLYESVEDGDGTVKTLVIKN